MKKGNFILQSILRNTLGITVIDSCWQSSEVVNELNAMLIILIYAL